MKYLRKNWLVVLFLAVSCYIAYQCFYTPEEVNLVYVSLFYIIVGVAEFTSSLVKYKNSQVTL